MSDNNSADNAASNDSSWTDTSGGWDQGGNAAAGVGDSVTEVTQTTWLQRLISSFVGVLVGIGFIGGSIFLLAWNENRAVTAIRALDDGAAQVVEAAASPVDPAKQGRLVHVTGPLRAATAPRDPTFGVVAEGSVRLRRTLEMYQWRESESTHTEKTAGGGERKTKTYSYSKVWSDTPINSGSFHQPSGHGNPGMPARSMDFDAPDARLGDFRVDPAVLHKLDDFTLVNLPAPGAQQRGFRPDGDWLYRGVSSGEPAVGDMRLKFSAIAAQSASVVAGQADGTLTPFRGRSGYTIALAHLGVRSAADLIEAKKEQEAVLTWILRFVGFFVMLLGFMMVMKPLTLLLAFIPFVESIVGAGVGLLALMISVPLTLLTIAVAWLAVRPVVAGGLIAAGVAVFWLLGKRGKARAAARMVPPPPPQPAVMWPR